MVRRLNCQVQILSLNPTYLTFIFDNKRRQILTSRIYLIVVSNYQQQIHIFEVLIATSIKHSNLQRLGERERERDEGFSPLYLHTVIHIGNTLTLQHIYRF